LLLLASWSEVPTTMSRDKTWAYISQAAFLAIELRLDTALPYCVQTDPLYDRAHHDLLVRNAVRVYMIMVDRFVSSVDIYSSSSNQHRCCLLLYIYDRVIVLDNGIHRGEL
jgi:hypothetical protein